MIKVILADDHTIITDGVANLLKPEEEFEVIAICKNGEEVLSVVPEHEVDVILMDISMPIMNGIDCARVLLERYPFIKIAILTMHVEKALIKELMNMGVKGYFSKTIEKRELIHALKTIATGQEYFPSDVTKALVKPEKITPDVTQDPRLSELSEREIEIIRLVAAGLSNKEIGEKLFISHRTVDTHRTNLMRKLDIHNIAGLVRFAFENKLVS